MGEGKGEGGGAPGLEEGKEIGSRTRWSLWFLVAFVWSGNIACAEKAGAFHCLFSALRQPAHANVNTPKCMIMNTRK